MVRATLAVAAISLSLGCQVTGLIGSNAHTLSGADGGEAGSGEGTDTDERYDVGGGDLPACLAPEHFACDAADDDRWHALGLNCPGETQVQGTFVGPPRSILVHDSPLGEGTTFAPKEGERFVILSTGDASHLPRTPQDIVTDPEVLNDPDGCCFGDPQTCPCTNYQDDPATPEDESYDLSMLPAPMNVDPVDPVDFQKTCFDDASLVGNGDCSNTLWAQWDAAVGISCGQPNEPCTPANDYVELRVNAVVPEDATALSYNVAFFTVEYPLFVQSAFNDMYVAWLESEQWTGNISFDDEGNPLTVNAAFLDLKDAPSESCPAPCEAPELQGFALQGHAGTRWLTTRAPVRAGESITLVFAIFDLSDGAWDSMVLLDNFEWTCDTGQPPVTTPVG